MLTFSRLDRQADQLSKTGNLFNSRSLTLSKLALKKRKAENLNLKSVTLG
jgi:hypothetical protein